MAEIVVGRPPCRQSTMVMISIWRAAYSTRSSAANPLDPYRSNIGTWNLTAAARPFAACSMRIANSSAPSASTLYPQSVRSFRCGSMPTHNGPYLSMEFFNRRPKSDLRI